MSTTLLNKERFIPSRLSNLAVWLDGADSRTITLSGSTTEVTRWNDKSSNANNFSVKPVPPPPAPEKDNVTQTNVGVYSYTTSLLYFSTVFVSLSGAGGGSAAAIGAPGGGAIYTFSNVPPSTMIRYTVSGAGTPGNGLGGGGGATSLTIGGNTTIIAGGGGSGVKNVNGDVAAPPFGGGADAAGDAGFYYFVSGTTTQTVPGFSHTVGGGSPASGNGSIVISPASSNFTSAGSATFNVPVLIDNATITVNGAGGGGSGGGNGGNVVYTGKMPAGIYTWYVGNTGSSYNGGTGYKSGTDGPFVNAATLPFGGQANLPGNSGLVVSGNPTTDFPGGVFTNTIGGGSAKGVNGSITIDISLSSPFIPDNGASKNPEKWTSPGYSSTVTIVLQGAGGGGGSSGDNSGDNVGGSGGTVQMVLTNVSAGTEFTYFLGGGGGGSTDTAPQTPSDNKSVKDGGTLITDGGGGGGALIDVGRGTITPPTIIAGTAGSPGGSTSTGNGAGGGGYSQVSYYDPILDATVTLVAGGGGGGAGYLYHSGGQSFEGGSGGFGGETATAPCGGLSGKVSDSGQSAGPGGNGTYAWDNGKAGAAWNPELKSTGGNGNNGGIAGAQGNENHSGGNGGSGYVSFSAVWSGTPTTYSTPGSTNNFIPSETSGYIVTVNGAGGGGGAGGQGVLNTTLYASTTYPCIVGAGGNGGYAGGQTTFGNIPYNAKVYTLIAGGGGGSGFNGNGGGGSSALVFPDGNVLGAGGGCGVAPGGGNGGGSDNQGTNGGTPASPSGQGFASSGLTPPPQTNKGGGAAGGNQGSIFISYTPTTITTKGGGTFTAQVSGAYTITVNGAGGGGKQGGLGVYTTNILSGTSFTYFVGGGGTGASSGGETNISSFVLSSGPAVLKAGGGGGLNSTLGYGVAGESAYGGNGGKPGNVGYNNIIGAGLPGVGGSTTLGDVISITGGGSFGNGAVYFTVSYTTPVISPSLTTYTNPGVFFSAGYMAVPPALSGLGSAKSIVAVYQCSGGSGSMNIGLGTNVSGASFGVCQTGGNLYSPYQYGNGYDLMFTPSNYTALSYAFASYSTAPYTITGMPGFNDASMNAAAFENLVVDSSLIVGRQLAGYPSGDFTLYELIATSNALSASDRQEVEAYLAAKWGFTLPPNHPYKDFQPSGDQWIIPDLPTTISGLVSWLDMTYPGQTGTNIVDRVGGSFSLRGSTLDLSNINNHPSLFFPGTTNTALYRYPINYPPFGSGLFVFTVSDTRTSLPIIAFSGSPLLSYNGNNNLLSIGNTDGYGNITEPSPISVTLNTGPNLVFFAWDGINYYLSANGQSPVVGFHAELQTSDKFTVGMDYKLFTGVIPRMNFGELVVYSQYFEQSERQLLEGYLAWKWNIEGNLPSGHPYAKESPIGATVAEVSPLNIPAQIPSLITWLDAADSETFMVSGQNVSWYDKSATSDVFEKFGLNGQPSFTYTNTGKGPSLPGVYFNGITSLVGNIDTDIYNQPWSCFLVATILGNAQVFTGGFQYGGGTLGNSFGFYSQGGSAVSPMQGSADVYMNSFNPIQPGGPYVFFAQIYGVNGNTPSNAGGCFQFSSPPSRQGTNGQNYQPYPVIQTPWILGTCPGSPISQNFYIHEFLCFSEYFSDGRRQLVEGYIAWKWGLQTQLPQGHPYKLQRPQSA